VAGKIVIEAQAVTADVRMSSHRLRGAALLALGVLAILMPFAVGDWVLALLGLILLVAGGCELAATLSTSDQRLRASDYVGGLLSTLAGLLLLPGRISSSAHC
jgi:uncharacterized membrane protein HdeD (DUF308 family)